MEFVADTHVHMYPFYDPCRALEILRDNLSQAVPGATCLAFLAERWDCSFFKSIEEGREEAVAKQFQVSRFANCLMLQEAGKPDLFLFPGRQVITKERVEILSLISDEVIADGLTAAKVTELVLHHGGLPVLSWAPGKWFFARKPIVAAVIDGASPGELLLGDTSLRPLGWSTPLLMRKAVQKGLSVIAGSDPLPFPGEELAIGSYGICFSGEFDPANPAASIKMILQDSSFQPALIGRRGGPLKTLKRLIANARAK